jgi:hypothetical protein
MQLIEQFRVVGFDGQQHSVACYRDFVHQPDIIRYCLDGGQDLQRVDDETFLSLDGIVFRRRMGPLNTRLRSVI